jgi:hypothetical protein
LRWSLDGLGFRFFFLKPQLYVVVDEPELRDVVNEF